MMQPLPSSQPPEKAPVSRPPSLPTAILNDDEGILEEVHLLIDEKSPDGSNPNHHHHKDLEQGGSKHSASTATTTTTNTTNKLQQYEPEPLCSRKNACKILLCITILLLLVVMVVGRFAPKFINGLGAPSKTGGSEDVIVATPLKPETPGIPGAGAAAYDPETAAIAAELKKKEEDAKSAPAKAAQEAEEARKKKEQQEKEEKEKAAKGNHVPGKPMGGHAQAEAQEAAAAAAAAAAEQKKKEEEEEAHRQKKEKEEAEQKQKQKQKEEEEAKAAAAASATTAAAAAAAAAAATSSSDIDLTKLQETLTAARKTTADAIQALEDEYGPEDAPVLFKSMHFINSDYIKNKLIRAILGQNPTEGKANSDHDFVVSFMGTSVTAGHDNYFNQSYPIVFGDVLQEAFTAAGINLEVRNHAMGNNPLIPASFVVRSFCGADADAVAWEFCMMLSGGTHERSSNLEIWIRNALNLPKRPALMFLDAGDGSRNPGGQPASSLEPHTGEPEDFSKGSLFGKEGDLLEYYRAFGPHTQSMHEAVWTLDTTDKYNFNALVRAGKPSPKPAPWHAGPGGHRLRAHILGYHYLNLLQEALEEVAGAVEKDVKEGKGKTKASSSSNLQAVLAFAKGVQEDVENEMPPPFYCDPDYCEFPVTSAVTYQPRVSIESSLVDTLVKSPKGINPQPPTIDGAENDHWHVQLFEADHDAVSLSQSLDFGYLDMKYVLQGNQSAGPLELELVSERENKLVICQPPGVFGRMPEQFVSLRDGAEVQVDGAVVTLIKDKEWYVSNEMKVSNNVCFFTEETMPAGKHSIQVRNINEEGKYISISVMFWW